MSPWPFILIHLSTQLHSFRKFVLKKTLIKFAMKEKKNEMWEEAIKLVGIRYQYINRDYEKIGGMMLTSHSLHIYIKKILSPFISG